LQRIGQSAAWPGMTDEIVAGAPVSERDWMGRPQCQAAHGPAPQRGRWGSGSSTRKRTASRTARMRRLRFTADKFQGEVDSCRSTSCRPRGVVRRTAKGHRQNRGNRERPFLRATAGRKKLVTFRLERSAASCNVKNISLAHSAHLLHVTPRGVRVPLTSASLTGLPAVSHPVEPPQPCRSSIVQGVVRGMPWLLVIGALSLLEERLLE
jgi:hypothetical protein